MNTISYGVPFRIIGRYKGQPIFLRSHPAYVEISIDGNKLKFRNYEEAMYFLTTLPRLAIKENKRNGEFIRGKNEI